LDVDDIKKRVLHALWETERPVKSRELAKKIGLSTPASTMHLIWLVKAGHVSTPKEGFYTVTEQGKKAIGLPEVDEKQATVILSSVPPELGFHFYNALGEYTGVFASSLEEFSEKLAKVNLRSLKFHVSRGDFEAWIRSLGDAELAKKINLVQTGGLSDEDLRQKILELVQCRCEELKGISRGAHEAYVVFRDSV
jgi:DNA-binding transcriptional ArsR family regulator